MSRAQAEQPLVTFYQQDIQIFNPQKTTPRGNQSNWKRYFNSLGRYPPASLIYFNCVYHWDRHVLEDDTFDSLLDINARVAGVQSIQKHSETTIRNHILFSAMVKYLFYASKYSKSVKLYNIIYAIIVFNSSPNLEEVSENMNKEYAKYEATLGRFVNDNLKAWKQQQVRTEQSLKDILREAFERPAYPHDRDKEEAYRDFIRDNVCSQMQLIGQYFLFSGYLTGIFQWFFEIFSNGHPLYSLHGLNLVHACNYLKASKNGRPKTLEEIEAYRPRNYIGPLIISKVGDRLLVWPPQLQDLTFENDDTLMYLVPFVQAGFTKVKRIQSMFVRIGLTDTSQPY